MILLLCLAAQLSFPDKPVRKQAPKARIVSIDKVWDRAPHNAFTDLVRYRERFYLAFREAAAHVSPDGAIRVLSSQNAERWDASAPLTYPVADLRDPKLSVTPDNRLMLTTAGAMHPPSDARHKTFAWISADGREWSAAEVIGEPNVWLWRITWNQRKAYGMGYATVEPRFLRSYLSLDGKHFQVLNPFVLDKDGPSETSIVFLPDDSALCLLRRDGGTKTGLLGRSRPPYRAWTWTDLGTRIGGPHMLRLTDGRIVAAVRLYEPKPRTALCWLDATANTLTEFLELPSGGDTSYAGLVYHNEMLHVSYYASHEGRTSIYFARVELPRP